MQRIQYAIFDLDGTIIDSEWAHSEAKKGIIAQLGGECTVDLSYYVGRSNRVFWHDVLEAIGKEADVDELVDRQFAWVLSALKREHQPESPGLTKLLDFCHETGRKTAICSGSDEHFVRDVLKYLNVEEKFDYVISSKDATRLKPAPDVFLAALAKAGIGAENAVTFEDSYSGTLAAHAAGTLCIGYTDSGRNPQNLSEADWRIQRLDDAIEIINTLEER